MYAASVVGSIHLFPISEYLPYNYSHFHGEIYGCGSGTRGGDRGGSDVCVRER
jgi:hypothetical protein